MLTLSNLIRTNLYPNLPCPFQDLDGQGRDNHQRVTRVVEFLSAQGYLVKMTAAPAKPPPAITPSTAVASTVPSIDNPTLVAVEEGNAAVNTGINTSTGVNEVHTIKNTLANTPYITLYYLISTF